MAGGQLVSDAELSEEIFSSEEASDFENYSNQKKNKPVIAAKKVKVKFLLFKLKPCLYFNL